MSHLGQWLSRDQAYEMLRAAGTWPKMRAATKEGFMQHVCTILECAGIEDTRSLFYKYLKTENSAAVNMDLIKESFTNSWACDVIEDAEEILASLK